MQLWYNLGRRCDLEVTALPAVAVGPADYIQFTVQRRPKAQPCSTMPNEWSVQSIDLSSTTPSSIWHQEVEQELATTGIPTKVHAVATPALYTWVIPLSSLPYGAKGKISLVEYFLWVQSRIDWFWFISGVGQTYLTYLWLAELICQ